MMVFAGIDEIPNGYIPFVAIILVEIFAAYCLLLSVALISESQGWTIVAMVLCNIFFNYYMYVISKIPAIESTVDGPIAVWNATVLWLLAIDVAVIGLIIGLTFYFQSRKKDFVC
jgi:ABC-2 type transport system permease protein